MMAALDTIERVETTLANASRSKTAQLHDTNPAIPPLLTLKAGAHGAADQCYLMAHGDKRHTQ
jgi:hypothetical protein